MGLKTKWLGTNRRSVVLDFEKCDNKFRLLAAERKTVDIKCIQERRVG